MLHVGLMLGHVVSPLNQWDEQGCMGTSQVRSRGNSILGRGTAYWVAVCSQVVSPPVNSWG